MFLLKIIVLLFLVRTAHAARPENITNFAAQLPGKSPSAAKCNESTAGQRRGYGLQFRLPFTDMEIHNERALKLMQEPQKQWMFMLHGNALYRLLVSRQEKRLSLIGLLSGSVSEVELLDVVLISWHDYLIIVVALEEHLEVYQISEATIVQRIEISKDTKSANEATDLNFQPIQQLNLPGRFKKFHIISPDTSNVMLIVALNFTKLYGKLRTYEWLNTYFNPIEELTTPPIYELHVVGSQVKHVVTGKAIKHQTKTMLTVYEVKSPSMKLRSIQTLTVESRTVHVATFRGKSYILACGKQQKQCNTFRMKEGQFAVYKQRPSSSLIFDKFGAGKYFLVGTRLNEVIVYTSGRLDCYGSLSSNESEVSSVWTLTNIQDETFIILDYIRPYRSLVRMIEVETCSGEMLGAGAANVTEVEDQSDLHLHQHMFEDTIAKLRSLLLKRKTAMDVFRRVKNAVSPKITELAVSYPVRVRNGKVNVMQVIGKSVLSPVQLLNRIEDLRRKYGSTRYKRGLDVTPIFALGNSSLLRVKQLKVNNLIYERDVLEGVHLDKTAKPHPILSISQNVTTNILQTPELITSAGVVDSNLRQMDSTEGSVLKVNRLNVDRINKIPFDAFHSSLFLKNRDTEIHGTLILQNLTKVANLSTPRINEKHVDKIFNLKHPQNVSSNILMARFFVRDLKASKINGLNFTEDIVFSGRDTVIETPVNIYRMSVAGDLWLGDNSTFRPFQTSSNELPLQQYYGGKVVINGSLTVQNLETEAPGAKILVNNFNLTEENIKKSYLLQNEPQVFDHPVVFSNTKITVPSFSTRFLNGHPTEQHLRNTPVPTSKNPLFLVFMKARIEGDLICRKCNTKVLELLKNAVKYGEVANITGSKIFQAPLGVESLFTLELNGLPVHELVTKSQLSDRYEFNGHKSFENVLVSDHVYINEQLNCTYLNNLPLLALLGYDYHLPSLSLKHKLHASNIVFQKINGISFDNLFAEFNVEQERLILQKELIIEGNARFGENLNVKFINDIGWNAYQSSLVRNNEDALIEGTTRFYEPVTLTEELVADEINSVHMGEVLNNILMRSKPQLITGVYTFDELNASNVDVSVINDIATSSFIDLRSENVVIGSDIVAPSIIVHGNLTVKFGSVFDFSTLAERLQKLQNKPWRNLGVLENAKWNITTSADKLLNDELRYLYKNAVTRSGIHTITGTVKLHQPIITKMTTKTTFPNGIDLDFVLKDSLKKNVGAQQIVDCIKTFARPLRLKKMKVASSLNAIFMNEIDILRLNSSLYRLSSKAPIVGRLHFVTPPAVGHLTVLGLVNGIDPQKIYHNYSTPLPPIKLHNLFVETSLTINDVNDMSLDYLLENRVLKNGEALEIFGFLTFENLVLNEQALLQSINGIQIDSLVFKQNNHLQPIAGTKIITGDLILEGPSHVMYLNGKDLIETYQNSVLTNANHNFDNLIVDSADFDGGVIMITDLLTQRNNNERSTIEKPETHQEIFKAISDELEYIKTSETKKINLAERPLYLDYIRDAEILWQKPNETIAKSELFPLGRKSLCEQNYLQVEISKDNPHRLYLTNITSMLVTANAYNLSIKAKNYCHSEYEKVRSKVTVSNANATQIFGMRKFVEKLEIYTPNNQDLFVLFNNLDMSRNRNEIRILKILQGMIIKDWQSLQIGVNKASHLQQFPGYTFLAVSSLLKNHPVLTIFELDGVTHRFEKSHTIDGVYDIISVVKIDSEKYHLILSCRQCQIISIYEITRRGSNDTKYEIFQILKPKTLVDKLHTFSQSDGSLYLLALSEQEQDYYHLYKYGHIQGWLHHTYGYFHNIELALPLRGQSLEYGLGLLLCGGGKCGLVKSVT